MNFIVLAVAFLVFFAFGYKAKKEFPIVRKDSKAIYATALLVSSCNIVVLYQLFLSEDWTLSLISTLVFCASGAFFYWALKSREANLTAIFSDNSPAPAHSCNS